MHEAIGADRSIFSSMLGIKDVRGDNIGEWLWELFTTQADPTGATAPKPLMPARGMKLDLILARHKRSIDFDLTKAEAVPVIELLKNEYRALYQAQRDGLIPAEQHRRELTRWGEKYRINNPEDVFVPADVPKETRLPHATTVTSAFTGNENPLSESGAWSAGEANWGPMEKNSGVARCVNLSEDAAARHTTTLGNDHYAQAVYTFNGAAAGPLPGTAVRMQNGDEPCYIFYTGRISSVSGCWLYEISAAFGFSELDSGGTPTSGQTNKLDVTGSNLTGTDNGVTECSATDTSLASGFAGIACYTDGAVTNATLDNFEASDGAGGGGISVPVAYRNLQHHGIA
jgi:hypothetical protein